MGKLGCALLIGSLACAAPLHAQDQVAARPTMIFFGWDKPEIDRDAAAILDQLVAAVGNNPGAKLRIIGHSDRSGPAASNRRTSLQRAEAVRAYLVQRGVAASAMSIAGLGEEQPVIATEDGVREPQNRRVEIALASGAARSFAIRGADGASLGSVTLAEEPAGLTINVSASGLPPGAHGIHLHEKGLCDGPEFKSAGAHWNPAGKQHGRDNPAGAHLGDLANLSVQGNGFGSAIFPVEQSLADVDGTALVIHAKPDDHKTDPSGASGDRIACAVLAAPE